MKSALVLGIVSALLLVQSAYAAKLETSWSVATAKNQAGAVERTIRYRGGMPVWVQKGSYKTVVVLSWPSSTSVGMPSTEESTLHRAFELRTRNAQEAAKAGVLATVITGDGKVEWMYYARSNEEFMTVLNKSRAGQLPVPITVEFKQAPLWTTRLTIGDGK